jgi:endonuclease/exonuclease/phosphatase family metal-dependent hydrolase
MPVTTGSRKRCYDTTGQQAIEIFDWSRWNVPCESHSDPEKWESCREWKRTHQNPVAVPPPTPSPPTTVNRGKPTPTTPPDPNPFMITVATVNAKFGDSNKNVLSRLQYDQNVQRMTPDFIFIQESPEEVDVRRTIRPEDPYELVDRVVGPGKHELLSLLRHKNSPWNVANVRVVDDSGGCPTKRAAAVYDVVHRPTGTTMRVANVHLCGGRYDEPKLRGMTPEGLGSMKTAIIKDVVEPDPRDPRRGAPDVVLGDFNADFNKSNADHLKTNYNWTQPMVDAWNEWPHRFLYERGYRLLNAGIDKTSHFGGKPDAIYVRESRWQSTARGWIDLMSQNLSEHDGLIARFRFRGPSTKQPVKMIHEKIPMAVPPPKTVSRGKPTPTTSPDPNPLGITVATVNAQFGYSNKNVLSRLQYDKNVQKMTPDFIFIQESPVEANIRRTLRPEDPYELVPPVVGPGEHELLSLLRHKNSPWNVANVRVVDDSGGCPTKRAAAVYDVVHRPTGTTLRVANVHLCGGRFDEPKMRGKDPEVLGKIKTAMIRDVVEPDPRDPRRGASDIVLGDFNADLKGSNANFLITTHNWTQPMVDAWNEWPHWFLGERGYRLVNAGVEKTSLFGGTPDAIYVRDESRWELTARERIDLMSQNLSDHDGIIARFRGPSTEQPVKRTLKKMPVLDVLLHRQGGIRSRQTASRFSGPPGYGRPSTFRGRSLFLPPAPFG